MRRARARDWASIAARAIAVMTATLVCLAPARSAASEENAWAALRGGAIVLFRHAHAPGGGDPQGMRLGDCATQRNLDAKGREQARRIGRAFREARVEVGRVLTSEWCRSRETAELAFPGRAEIEPAFNSFFSRPSERERATANARAIVLGWRGPGALVVTTHQVNISALVGRSTSSGEGIVVRSKNGELTIVGSIRP